MIGFDIIKFIDDTDKVSKVETKAARYVLQKAGYAIRIAAAASIEKSRSYSKPGEPPHTRKGQLAKSLWYSVEGSESVVIGPRESIVGSHMEIHEFGGTYEVRKGVMATYPARPFMGPALEKNLDKIPAFWSAEIHN